MREGEDERGRVERGEVQGREEARAKLEAGRIVKGPRGRMKNNS